MSPHDYWAWYDANMFWGLIIGVPVFFIALFAIAGWQYLSEWYDEREPKDHIDDLFGKPQEKP